MAASIGRDGWGAGRARLRRRTALGALILQGLIGWGIVSGLSVRWPQSVARAVQAITLQPEALKPPPEPPPAPKPARAQKAEARAAPPARRARPVPVIAPPPVFPIVIPPPITAAPVPAQGNAAQAGAAEAGPGTGAGGAGEGLGAGEGDGGGGGGTPSRWLKGRIRPSDFPDGALADFPGAGQDIEGTLTTRYTVDESGRVTRCAVIRSSGSALLDRTTCRLMQERYRFAPARDAGGRPVPDEVTEDHDWIIHARR